MIYNKPVRGIMTNPSPSFFWHWDKYRDITRVVIRVISRYITGISDKFNLTVQFLQDPALSDTEIY